MNEYRRAAMETALRAVIECIDRGDPDQAKNYAQWVLGIDDAAQVTHKKIPLEELAQLKIKRDQLMADAMKASHDYFVACDVGDERIAAGKIFDNLRNASSVY